MKGSGVVLVETTEGEWGYICDDAFTFRLVFIQLFQNCYTATRCTSNESIYREALLICRYAGYRNYLEYRKVVEDDLDRLRKATDIMEMMFNPLIMLDNLDCSKAGFHRNLEHGRIRRRSDP